MIHSNKFIAIYYFHKIFLFMWVYKLEKKNINSEKQIHTQGKLHFIWIE